MWDAGGRLMLSDVELIATEQETDEAGTEFASR